MKMNGTQPRPETLGAFLARVRPGDACACCGAALRSTSRVQRTARTTSVSLGSRLPSPALVCPECGCEISEETGTDVEESRRELTAAA